MKRHDECVASGLELQTTIDHNDGRHLKVDTNATHSIRAILHGNVACSVTIRSRTGRRLRYDQSPVWGPESDDLDPSQPEFVPRFKGRGRPDALFEHPRLILPPPPPDRPKDEKVSVKVKRTLPDGSWPESIGPLVLRLRLE